MVDERALATALDALPVAVLVTTREGGVVWANRALRSLTRGASGAADGRAYERLVEAVLASEAVQTTSVAPARLPTDEGLVERELSAVALPDRDDVVVVSFPVASDVRAAALADDVRARVEALLEHTSDIITVLDADGTIRFSNAAAGRVTGFSGGEVNGLNALDLVHPDDAERVTHRLLEALGDSGVGPMTELRVRFADGTWHDVEAWTNNLSGVPPIDGLVVTLHDVTERKRSEAFARSLVENLTDVVVILDENFEVTYASPAITRLVHASPESNLGRSAFDDIHPDDEVRVRESLTQLASSPPGSTVRVDLRLETRPGSDDWRWVEATAVNRIGDPAVAGIVCTLRDVTEQRQLDRLKDDFLATVSHELRTPLATITGFADLLRHGTIDDRLRDDLLARIAASADEMRSMVDNVLDFSALEAGEVRTTLVPVRLRDAVETAVATVGQQLAQHVVVNDVGRDVVVRADAYGLGHVLRNLLTNAAKYSQPRTMVTVRATTRAGHVIVEVTDEGIGIAPDQHALVFERFYRAPGAAFVGRGTGIGLNIVRRYVDLMEGRVGVRSVPGEGSTFWVELPSAPPAPPAASPPS